jgi:hypothetical protein
LCAVDIDQIFNIIKGVVNNVPMEQRVAVLTAINDFMRRAETEMSPDKAAQAEDGNRAEKRCKIEKDIDIRVQKRDGERDEKEREVDDEINEVSEGEEQFSKETWLRHTRGTVTYLLEVTQPLSRELTAERLNKRMKIFRDELVIFQGNYISDGTRTGVYLWTRGNATNLANHVFVDMLVGISSRIVCASSANNDATVHTSLDREGTVVLANSAAAESSIPPTLAALYQKMGLFLKPDIVSSKAWDAVLHQVLAFELFEAYQELMARAESRDRRLLNYLTAKGQVPLPGRRWKSVLVAFLAN